MGNGNWYTPSSSDGVPSWGGRGRAQENNQSSSTDSNGNNILPPVDFESSLNPLSAIFSPLPPPPPPPPPSSSSSSSPSSIPSMDTAPLFNTTALLDTVADDLLGVAQEMSLSPDPEAFSYDYLENMFNQPENHSPNNIDDWFDNIVPPLSPISEFQAHDHSPTPGDAPVAPPSLISGATADTSTSGFGTTAPLPLPSPSRKANQPAASTVTFPQPFSSGVSLPPPILLPSPNSGATVLPPPSPLPPATASTSTSEATARLTPPCPVRKANQQVASGVTLPRLFPVPSLATGLWSTNQTGSRAASRPTSVLPSLARGAIVFPLPSNYFPPLTSLLPPNPSTTRMSEATARLPPLPPAKRANEPAVASGASVLPLPSFLPALASFLPRSTAYTRTTEATTCLSSLPLARRANGLAAASRTTILPRPSFHPPLTSVSPPATVTTTTSVPIARQPSLPPVKRAKELAATSGATVPLPSTVSPPYPMPVGVDQLATSEATLPAPIFSSPLATDATTTGSLEKPSKSTRRRGPGKNSRGGLATRTQKTPARQQSTADEPGPPLLEGQAPVDPSPSSAVDSTSVRKRKTISPPHLTNEADITREPDPNWNATRPLTITAEPGEDVSMKILSMAKGRVVSILAATGAVSSVELMKPNTSEKTASYTVELSKPNTSEKTASFKGRFGILSLNGTLLCQGRMISSSMGHLTISLAGEDGGVVSGVVMGPVIAASSVQISGCIYTPASGETAPKAIEEVIKEQVRLQVASIKGELQAQMEEKMKRQMQEWKAQTEEQMKREMKEWKAQRDERRQMS